MTAAAKKRTTPVPEPNKEELLRCEQLVIGYGKHALLPAFDWSVYRGQMALIVGHNGAGKTTMLRTLLGLLPTVSGRVHMSDPQVRMSYVSQATSLDELLPVPARMVVDWGSLRGWGFLRPFARKRERQRRDDCLAELGAAYYGQRAYRDLSGGQKQRILFARMLMSEAELVLLDEPTASMDIAAEREAYTRMAHLARERNVAVIVVTHTIDVAAEFTDQVLYFERGEREGPKVWAGEPQVVFNKPSFLRHFGKVGRNAE